MMVMAVLKERGRNKEDKKRLKVMRRIVMVRVRMGFRLIIRNNKISNS